MTPSVLLPRTGKKKAEERERKRERKREKEGSTQTSFLNKTKRQR
jgi:hypothetical protein